MYSSTTNLDMMPVQIRCMCHIQPKFLIFRDGGSINSRFENFSKNKLNAVFYIVPTGKWILGYSPSLVLLLIVRNSYLADVSWYWKLCYSPSNYFFLNESHETVRSSIDRAGKNYKITTLEGRNQEKEKNTTTHTPTAPTHNPGEG